MVMVASMGPVWAMEVTLVSSWLVRLDFCWASRLAVRAAPSQGVPLWNVTPSRMVMVQAVKSALGVMDEAR